MLQSSCCCAFLLSSETALVLGQSSPIIVVSHTARISCLGMASAAMHHIIINNVKIYLMCAKV